MKQFQNMQVGNGAMEPRENKNAHWEDLQTRVISAVALFVLALLCITLGSVVFTALIILAAILLMKEWETLNAGEKPMWYFLGYPYLIIPCACIVWLRSVHTAEGIACGFTIILALVAVISATDTGAYFVGRRFGRTQLAPAISPKKTWEGLAGGMMAAVVAGVLFSPYIHVPHSFLSAIFISLFLAVLAQIGDLFKSWIKRRAGVKDSGTLIPGHGGLLDRMDGYMFTAPVLALLVYSAL